MLDLDIIEKFSTIIVAIVNIILVIIVLIQIRDSRKPVIFTKILTRDQDVEVKPDVLVTDTQYLTILNRSNNLAKSLDISYSFTFNGISIDVHEKKLHHLNPEEATKILLKLKNIHEQHPELFEDITEGKISKKIPKETIRIHLRVKILYNPLVLQLFCQKIEDDYEIEWGSLKSFPEFEKHPVIFCENKRDEEYYIHKLGVREEQKECSNFENW